MSQQWADRVEERTGYRPWPLLGAKWRHFRRDRFYKKILFGSIAILVVATVVIWAASGIQTVDKAVATLVFWLLGFGFIVSGVVMGVEISRVN